MVKFFNPLTSTHREIYSWTLRVLREYGLKPRKSLSQNFIVNPNLLREIVSYVDQGDIIEIGCGIGTLSLALLTKTRSLTCIEIDSKLCRIARDLVNSPFFTIINGDARIISFTRKQVVSNLPYHITSDILVKIARENNVTKATLTIQREVANRLLAKPGSKNYGRLTVLVNTLFEVKNGGVYSPRSFYPKPEVYHRVVILTRKREYTEEIKALEKLTHILFTQRRRLVEKTLTTMLKIDVSRLDSETINRIKGKRVYMLDPSTLQELAGNLLREGVI